MNLAKFASRFTILVRSETLAQSMSEYLINEIDGTHNIYVNYCVEVVGDSALASPALVMGRLRARASSGRVSIPRASCPAANRTPAPRLT